jgi:NAD(P)-dependent dehydrogenase (short-subunit alcohol dehydrogenase family)
MTIGKFADQVVWISGATSGIGAAAARLFAAEGAKVAVVGRTAAAGRRIVDEIRHEGGQALFTPCDVSQPAAVQDSIDWTVREFGALHVLVNNAGMVQVKMLHECSDEDWDYVMAVNVKSMFWAFKAALPHLRRQPRSHVVNVGSISSFVGQGATPVYTTSKHAILGLTRSIALDYAADGIRCNCVCPGITDTPLLREHLNQQPDPENALATRLRRVPLGIALTPHDVAKAILFFSGGESSGITGTSLVIDCGYLTAAEWDTEAFKQLRGAPSPGRPAVYEPKAMTMPRGSREVVR